MLNKLFTLSIILFVCFSSFLSADSSHYSEFSFIERKINLLHSELDKESTGRLSEEMISKNISYLEEMLLQALNRSERKLEKYKNRLRLEGDLVIDDGCVFKSSTQKKVKAVEKRIKVIKEILFSIQVLKLRFDV